MRLRKGALVSLMLAASIAGFFWTRSRIPQLGEKAMMGGRSSVAAISFGELYPVDGRMPLWQRIGLTAVNWGNTNWKGMTFGLLFAAAVLTLLSFLPRRGGRNVWINTIKGVALGTPLGLCVNCATPVSRGLFAGGLRSETALAALFASPTLNPIVLTILFSMFPLDMAVTKVALTLLFILLLVPLFTLALQRAGDDRRLGDGGAGLGRLDRAAFSPSWWQGWLFKQPGEVLLAGGPGSDDTWAGALAAVGRRLGLNLWFILRVTLPLMVLAGVLGAIVVELLPLARFADLRVSLPTLAAAALVGTFLPVPVAFDVLLVAVMRSGGLPAPFAMTLLVTLGMFSVYPFLVVWQSMSRAVALACFGTVVLLGIGAGEYIRLHDAADDAAVRRGLEASLPRIPDLVAEEVAVARRHCAALAPRADACLSAWALHRVENGGDAAVCQALHDEPDLPSVVEWCQRRARSEEAVRAAVAAGHTAPCERLPADERPACRDGAIAVIASYDLARWIALCSEHGDPEEVRGCRRSGVLAVMAGDEEMCKYLDHPGDAAECVRLAPLTRAVSDRSAEACASVAPELARTCLQRVGDALIGDRLAADAITACDGLPLPAMVYTCRRRWIELRVKLTADAALCDRPEVAEARAGCLEAAAVRAAAREIAGLQVSKLSAAEPAPEAQRGSDEGQPEAAAAPRRVGQPLSPEGTIEISAAPHAPRTAAPGPRFTRLEGRELGITSPVVARALDAKEPFAAGRGLASGDVDNDGWTDLVLASEHGFELYKNLGGRFRRQPLAIPEIASADAFVVALVDVNNDGWLDVFLTSYGGGDYVVENDRHGFAAPRVTRLDSGEAIVTMAAGWADVDGDGLLDVVLGNWSYGVEKAFIPERSRNRLLRNRGQRFESLPLPGVPGETLTVLLSDLDGDGRPELLVGNDHDRPDQYYRLDERGRYQPIGKQAGIFPATPAHTMSIDSADLDNDGRLDLFATDMSFQASEAGDYCAPIVDAGDQQRCRQQTRFPAIVHNRDLAACNALDDGGRRGECVAAIAMELAVRSRDPGLCERIPARYPSHRAWCRNLVTRSHVDPVRPSDHLPQKARNVLLLAGADGRFKDRTVDLGVEASYWSWNARALDVDNDGWQDLYVGNGYRFAVIHPNVLFHNQGAGQKFVRREAEFGLGDLLNTPSWTALDLDNDGDLDIVATAAAGPVRVFRNNDTDHHAVTVSLLDERGNRFGVGARITVRDAAGRSQVREIKASGGFLSFDAPLAHFGLGPATALASLEVRWPGAAGATTRIRRALPADTHYTIRRPAR